MPECSRRTLAKKGRKGLEAGRKQKAQGTSCQLLKGAPAMLPPHPPTFAENLQEGSSGMKTILRQMRVPELA